MMANSTILDSSLILVNAAGRNDDMTITEEKGDDDDTAAAADEHSLLPVLKAMLGPREGEAIEDRAGGLEEALRPLIAAAPHSPSVMLVPPVVRYILHRLFSQCS